MSFLPKPGEDRKFFTQLVLAGFFFAITKILYETSPTVGIVMGGATILGVICYFSYRFIKFILSKRNQTGVIKENGRKTPLILLVLLLLILLAGLFYWFQVRPAQVKHDCSQTTVNTAYQKGWTVEQVKAHYEFCLHDKGL